MYNRLFSSLNLGLNPSLAGYDSEDLWNIRDRSRPRLNPSLAGYDSESLNSLAMYILFRKE